jgi:hypothetical protein
MCTQERTNSPVALQNVPQRIDGTDERSTADLYHRSIERCPAIERSGRTYYAVVSDHRRFHDLARRKRDDERNHRIDRKVDFFDAVAKIVERVLRFEIDALQVRIDGPTVCVEQRLQQYIRVEPHGLSSCLSGGSTHPVSQPPTPGQAVAGDLPTMGVLGRSSNLLFSSQVPTCRARRLRSPFAFFFVSRIERESEMRHYNYIIGHNPAPMAERQSALPPKAGQHGTRTDLPDMAARHGMALAGNIARGQLSCIRNGK